MGSNRRSILVLGCYRHTIPVVRSLSRAGYHTILGVDGEGKRSGFVHRSRHVREVWHYSGSQKRPSEFPQSLISFISEREDIESIWPIGEVSLRALLAVATQLPRRIDLIAPDRATAQLCLDKYLSVVTAKRLQIPVPESVIVSNLPDLRASIREIGLPCIVKANDSQELLLERKCIHLLGDGDIQSSFSQWPEGHQTLLVQRKVEGLRHNCMFVARDGRLALYFESCVLRTDRWDYTGLSVSDVSVAPDPRHVEFCGRIVSELDYSGPGCVQFLVDRKKDRTTFLEINPRLDATLALPLGCGSDIPRSTLVFRQGTKDELDTRYVVGRRRQWLLGDIRSLISHVQEKRVDYRQASSWLRDLVVDFFRADVRTTWSWSDPMPTLWVYLIFAGHLAKSASRQVLRAVFGPAESRLGPGETGSEESKKTESASPFVTEQSWSRDPVVPSKTRKVTSSRDA